MPTPTDLSISQLTALPGAQVVPGDLVPFLDVSDTTMAGSGTNKSLTFADNARASLRTARGVYNVLDYGAVADGATDCSAAFQAAVNLAAANRGGTVYVPANTSNFYMLQSTVTVTTPNVWIVGDGAQRIYEGGTAPELYSQTASRVAAGTSLTGVMFDWYSPTGATARTLQAGGMSDLYLNCNGFAATALRVRSMVSGRFCRLWLYGNIANNYIVDLGCNGNTSANGEARDLQNCIFEDLWVRCSDIGSSHGFRLNGSADFSANTSLNEFRRIWVTISATGIGFDFYNCDRNRLEQIRVFGATGAKAAIFRGSNSNQNDTPRGNEFDYVGALPITCEGTDVKAWPSGSTNAAYPACNIVTTDMENGGSIPVMGVAAGVNIRSRTTKDLVTLAYAATITLHPYAADTQRVVLTGNVTFANPTVIAHTGRQLVLIVAQDATGGRTITFGTVFKKISVLSTVASKTNVITFVFDGTNWIEVGSALGI